ncbi:hypothetical protein PE066_12800 [Ramlibacter tataouinensis]|uniref:hypothetical protein n=1 Tax=Ramlibacter tataouinensis TaxID=94132 RepID=UPI0022F3B09A|nr:hypothetical protein [Ramlibacter tataouinensis]WBY00351.1 hypothetical protein PE066_12800 [Ramlibacter tataouinensis]
MTSASAFAPERARETSFNGTLSLARPARPAVRPLQPHRRRALRYHFHLAQRADRSPVRAVDFDDPAVFDACCRVLVRCAVIGRVEVPPAGAAAGSLSFRSELPLRRVFEQLEPTVQACNRALRDTPWQFLLQAGDP